MKCTAAVVGPAVHVLPSEGNPLAMRCRMHRLSRAATRVMAALFRVPPSALCSAAIYLMNARI
jgi:hypothetical protein